LDHQPHRAAALLDHASGRQHRGRSQGRRGLLRPGPAPGPDPTLLTLVNEKKWNELPKSYQAALTAACGEANAWMPAKYDAQNPPALRRLIGSGTKIHPFPRSVLEAAEKASYELYEELKAKSKHWARVYPEWKKFRDEQYL